MNLQGALSQRSGGPKETSGFASIPSLSPAAAARFDSSFSFRARSVSSCGLTRFSSLPSSYSYLSQSQPSSTLAYGPKISVESKTQKEGKTKRQKKQTKKRETKRTNKQTNKQTKQRKGGREKENRETGGERVCVHMWKVHGTITAQPRSHPTIRPRRAAPHQGGCCSSVQAVPGRRWGQWCGSSQCKPLGPIQ